MTATLTDANLSQCWLYSLGLRLYQPATGPWGLGFGLISRPRPQTPNSAMPLGFCCAVKGNQAVVMECLGGESHALKPPGDQHSLTLLLLLNKVVG